MSSHLDPASLHYSCSEQDAVLDCCQKLFSGKAQRAARGTTLSEGEPTL